MPHALACMASPVSARLALDCVDDDGGAIPFRLPEPARVAVQETAWMRAVSWRHAKDRTRLAPLLPSSASV